MKTAAGLVQWANSWVGRRYWYGCVCYDCTQSRLDAKAKQYPSHYGASRMPQYGKDIADKQKCTDCVGLIKGYVMTENGVFKYNSAQDKSANGTYSAAKRKGAISSMPNTPGLCVRYDGHIGVFVGNGDVIEARGFAYGVVKTKLANRPWTHWLEHPDMFYGDAALPPPETEAYPLGFGARALRKGDTGGDVANLQRALIRLLYSVGKWGADGDFGAATESAARAYQSANKLEIDGIVGKLTRAMMESQLTEHGEDDLEDAVPESVAWWVAFDGAPGERANVRDAPSTAGRVMGIFRYGERLPWGGEDPEGWVAVRLGGELGYVSRRYARKGGG